MTIGSVIGEVAPVISIDVPENIFASSAREHVELVALANEMAQRIAEIHDWQQIKRRQTYTGNGEDDAWDLPAGYDRMPKAQLVWSSVTRQPVEFVADHDVWLERLVALSATSLGSYTLLGGQMVFNPVLELAETATFFYLTSYIVTDVDGALKATFTANDDTFRLSERLLKLGIIWQHKANKGLPYAEEMQNYEIALSQRIARERGPLTQAVRGRAGMTDTEIAYPWALGQ
jgi:hypothetical protein